MRIIVSTFWAEAPLPSIFLDIALLSLRGANTSGICTLPSSFGDNMQLNQVHLHLDFPEDPRCRQKSLICIRVHLRVRDKRKRHIDLNHYYFIAFTL